MYLARQRSISGCERSLLASTCRLMKFSATSWKLPLPACASAFCGSARNLRAASRASFSLRCG